LHSASRRARICARRVAVITTFASLAHTVATSTARLAATRRRIADRVADAAGARCATSEARGRRITIGVVFDQTRGITTVASRNVAVITTFADFTHAVTAAEWCFAASRGRVANCVTHAALARGIAGKARRSCSAVGSIFHEANARATVTAREIAIIATFARFTQTVAARAKRFTLTRCYVPERIAAAARATGVPR
jgi:hypothetical protein